MAVDLRHEVLGLLVDLFARRVMDAKGRVCREYYSRRGGRRVLPEFGGFLGPAAAHLATTAFDGNPYLGNDELVQLALDAGQRLLIDHADVTPQTKPNHFTIYPLARLYELLGDQVGGTDRARWRETMARNLAATDALIDRAWENLGRPGPWAGTGPNHYFGWFAVAHQQAKLLGEAALVRKIEKAMLRHVKVQAPGGYFPEHIGPATGYQHVSLAGLAEYHRLNPRRQTLEALRRGVHFMVRAIYPDLCGIETFDERNRLGRQLGFQHGLLWTPEGRTLFARVLAGARRRLQERNDRSILRGREIWSVGGLFRCFDHAVATHPMRLAAALPIDGERFTWRLEDKGFVRKAGAWFYALSAWAHEVEQGNPYHLERTQALSFYHEDAGLIVGGGNDKRAYRNATIQILEGNDCHYFPALAGKLRVGAAPKVLVGGGACDRIEFDYGSVRADLEVRAESDRRLRVGLGVWTSQTQPQIWLVLQLPAGGSMVLRNGSQRLSLKKVEEGQAAKEYSLARQIESPAGWRMSLPKDSTLVWPHFPWNPYRPPTYRETPDAAVALVRVPLHLHNWRAEVVVTAGSR